jgi:hypothetical protein
MSNICWQLRVDLGITLPDRRLLIQEARRRKLLQFLKGAMLLVSKEY